MNVWIGVDLDGTLAYYTSWQGPEHIGEPIAPMLARVQKWLADGREVRIFTARANEPENIPYIQAWCLMHLGQVLPVTATKDYGMVVLYDDRCVRVITNTGVTLAPEA